MAQMRNKQNLDFIDALVDSFEKRIKELLDTGKYDIDEAVDIAYKQYPVMQEMQKWLQDELVKVASDGYGKKLPKNAQENLLKPWAVDELSLSDRTTAKKKSVLRAVKKELRAGINKSKNYEDVALSIFDGYKHGGVIPKQDIAKYLDRLTKLSSLDKEDKLFKQEMRKAERQIKNIKTGGLKAAYNQVAKMVETNREKAIEQAVYVGTQEKTRYFARRIARTELARAWHEGFIAKYNQDDDIVAYKWKLSSSHPVFDICDFYANADLYGLGKGVYPKNKVPILPAHPHCMCRLMPIVSGMIDNDEPKDNIEQGGREYIESLTDIEKKQLLGIKGTNKFSKGESWQKYLRNYKTDTFKNRLDYTEKGISNKRVKGEVFRRIDRSVLHSKEFSRAFARLDNKPEVNKSLEIIARKLLLQADGKDVEQVYLVHGLSGKILAKSRKGTEIGIKYTKDMYKAISKHKGEIIAIHNHPNEMPPTGNDFASIIRHLYKKAYVINNNLELYEYDVLDETIEPETIQFIIDSKGKFGADMLKKRLTDLKDDAIINLQKYEI